MTIFALGVAVIGVGAGTYLGGPLIGTLMGPLLRGKPNESVERLINVLDRGSLISDMLTAFKSLSWLELALLAPAIAVIAVWAAVRVFGYALRVYMGKPTEQTAKVLCVLGSGGHTGEMLAMLEPMTIQNLVFVAGERDTLSCTRAIKKYPNARFETLPRPREVHQPWLSSIVSSARCARHAIALVYNIKPTVIFCNGPGLCLIVVAAARVLGLPSKVMYVESVARVQTLSLTGLLIYYLWLADEFLVQWPELVRKYRYSKYRGMFV